ncbi:MULTISPECIES: DUF2637 domain-containing protein [unclassified Streptomyces]|uniref:DUF2637 domain-containing protein n=1 Tax=unclassified Streptomyces TaxID=2593676 RepID=UPI002E13043E|nr:MULTISPECIES: DUF2637 domain-containing protein [unclassified Streptomyces]WSR09825.1 DUF2637 domain-containing protein [Streptomyces sp. NBC_01208]WSR47451.1 DUF2637 domain-containing protein [Streptomyces sp. NBC_01201]
MTTTSLAKPAHISGWDRAIVIALGGAGCALSYDALQQMAIAIHVRGFLTYLFPLVIDGFIAYGIRALLVLRDAPLRARLYVWALFGMATAASIWANALHAVRLNEDAVAGPGLRLGDTVVAVLSTIAPLALAGAVHLYILIARRPVKVSDRENPGQAGHPGQTDRGDATEVTRIDRAGQQRPAAGQGKPGQPVTAPTGRLPLSLTKQATVTRSLTGDTNPADSGLSVTGDRDRAHGTPDLPGQTDRARPVTDRPDDAASVAGDQDSPAAVTAPPVTPSPGTDRDTRTADDRRSDPGTEELLKIARSAVRAEDKLTRKVVAQAIRGQQIPLSSDTLTVLMAQLREQHRQPVTSSRT